MCSYGSLFQASLTWALAGELRSCQLSFNSPVWTVKLTRSGISVSLSWPQAKKLKKKYKKKNLTRQSSFSFVEHSNGNLFY